MTYVHNEELEVSVGDYEVTWEVIVEVECTDPGSPMVPQSFNYGGDPEEPPSFEISNFSIRASKGTEFPVSYEFLEALIGSANMDSICNSAHEKASENYDFSEEPDCPDMD